MRVYIKYFSNSLKNEVFFSNEMLSKFQIIPRRLILNIGVWKREVEVKFRDDINVDTIGLSKYIINDFIIPDSIPYEVCIEGRNLHIGPIIAFLVETKKKNISEKEFGRLKNYYVNYGDIKGILYFCAADQINIENKTIAGYYYSINENKEGEWKEAIFPYPGVMIKKRYMPQIINDDIVDKLGDKIFNSYFFTKWDMWELLSPYENIRKNIPYTERLSNIEALDKMLETYGTVYLKQVRGYQSKGIIKVERSQDGYNFTDILEGATNISNPEEADKFIKDLNEQKAYIMQQGIKLKKYHDRMFDLRVILQKDKSMEWSLTGIIARFGKGGSIATKISGGGFALTGYEALKRVFDMSEKEVFLKQQEIVDICIEACKAFEGVGNYGDVGIDVMVDENKKVWILEVNKTHDHRFPLYSIEDTEMYHRIVTKPLEYAKALAGF